MKSTEGETALANVRCARLRVDQLHTLASVRGRGEYRVMVAGDFAWVRWEGETPILAEILVGRIVPIEGVELFVERGGRWYRLGDHLPAFDVAFQGPDDGVPLDRILLSGKLSAQRPPARAHEPLRVGVVPNRCDVARPATAMKCSLAALAAWADQATSGQLSRLQGALRSAAAGAAGEDDAFVLGPAGAIPLLSGGVRYAGTDLLVPLGFRVDPDLPEKAIRRALGAGEGDLVVMDEHGIELIARDAFRPLDRAGVRLAWGRISEAPTEEGRVP